MPSNNPMFIKLESGFLKPINPSWRYLDTDANNIGIAGAAGFGVGICPADKLPSYMVPMQGCFDPLADNYGNYQCVTDGSVMVWIPKFYYRITNNTASPYLGTRIEIASAYAFANEGEANASNYALHRAFIDEGAVKDGFFVDKYDWSLTNVTWSGATQLTGIASSIKNGNPISSAAATKMTNVNNYPGSFSNCISNGQTPADLYGGAWSAAKSRGNNFALFSLFIKSALAMLSMAHQQAAVGVTNCAWNDVLPYAPKGNNRSGVLGDQNDTPVTYSNPDDAYWTGTNQAAKTGSGSPFNKTTHNGQACGVADLNGNQAKISQGLTCIATSLTINAAVSTDGGTKVQITTTAAHGLSVNQQIDIESVVGMTDLNAKIHTVTDVVDTTNFKVALATVQTYTSAGTISKGTFYVLKESKAIKNITGSNSAATDHFGATGVAANMDAIAIILKSGNKATRYGSGTNQLLSAEKTRTLDNYKLTGLGMPYQATAIDATGTNNFGQDYYYQYIRNELCPLSAGYWTDTTFAGVWYLTLSYSRTYSYNAVSARSCLYV